MTAAQIIQAKIAQIGNELAYNEKRLEQRITNFRADAEESGTTRIALFLRHRLEAVTDLYRRCETLMTEKHLLETVLQEVEGEEGRKVRYEPDPMDSYIIPVQNAYGLLLDAAKEINDCRIEEALIALQMVLD